MCSIHIQQHTPNQYSPLIETWRKTWNQEVGDLNATSATINFGYLYLFQHRIPKNNGDIMARRVLFSVQIEGDALEQSSAVTKRLRVSWLQRSRLTADQTHVRNPFLVWVAYYLVSRTRRLEAIPGRSSNPVIEGGEVGLRWLWGRNLLATGETGHMQVSIQSRWF